MFEFSSVILVSANLVAINIFCGCAMIQLKSEYREAEHLSVISGPVKTANNDTEDVVVVLIKETEAGPTIESVDQLNSVISDYVFLIVS